MKKQFFILAAPFIFISSYSLAENAIKPKSAAAKVWQNCEEDSKYTVQGIQMVQKEGFKEYTIFGKFKANGEEKTVDVINADDDKKLQIKVGDLGCLKS